MHLIPVSHHNHEVLDMIRPLYEESFPMHERRVWDSLVPLLSGTPMRLLYIREENTFIGFVIVWAIGDWQYIEHFAIVAHQRGRQYGSQLLEHLAHDNNGQLVLEVEPPHDEVASRRIAFYERAGFSIAPFPYLQPPYRAGEAPVPLQVMSRPAITEQSVFHDLAAAIKIQVYESWQ